MDIKEIKPLGKRVILQSYKEEVSKNKYGIITPDDTEKESPQYGEVLNVGECEFLKKGQKVLFSKYTPDIITVDNKEYLMVKETDILAIIK